MAGEDALRKAQQRISGLERNTEELRQRLAELTGVINRSPAVVLRWRDAPGWPVESVSDGIRHFGYTPEDFRTGRITWGAFLHPDDADRVEADMERHAADRTHSFTLTFGVRTREGQARWVEAHVIALFAGEHLTHHAGMLLDVTERRRSELARAESERKFSALFHFSPIPFSIHALPDGRFIDVNRAFERASGFTREEVLGKTTVDLGLWDAAVRERYRRLLVETGALDGIEEELTAKSGQRYTTLLFAQLITLDHRPCYISAAIDITAHKAAEKALRRAYAEVETRIQQRTAELRAANAALKASTARLNHAEAIAHLGHYEVDLVRDRTTWSDELFRIFGMPREPVNTERFLMSVHPEDREQLRTLIEGALGPHPPDNRPASLAYRIIRGDGTLRTVEGTGVVERDAAGRPVKLFGTVQDITERKRTEEALRASEARLEEAQQLAHLGNFELILDTGQVIWSAEAFRIVGRDPNVGPPTAEEYVQRYVQPEDRQLLLEAIQGATDRAASFDVRYRLRREDGALRHIQSIGHPMRDRAGRVERIFGTMLDITERVETEARLQQLNNWLEIYARLVDNAPDAMMVIDRAYRFTIVNVTYARVQGLDRQAVLGKTIGEVVGTDYFNAMLRANIDQALGGREVHYEKWYDYPEIGQRYLEVHYFPLHADERIDWVAVILRDITERRASEEALMVSEARFRAFSEATTEGIVIHERGRILDVNRAFVEHMGYRYEDMLRMDLFDMVAPESRADVLARVLRNDPGPYEAVSLHKDGSRTIGEIRARTIRFRGQEVRVVAIREITERKQAEVRLQELLDRTEQWAAEMDATISAIADGVIIYGPGAVVRRMNTAASTLFGLQEEITPASLAKRLARLRLETADGHPLAADDRPHARALRGEVVRGQVIALHPRNRTVWVSASAAPIRASDGATVGAVVTLSDITELRNLQRRQEDLLHIVSHDLRTPLAVIHGHLQLLQEELIRRNLNGELQTNAQTISRGIQRMNVMIQDLVDLARLEGGQMRLELQQVALEPFLRDLLHRLEGVLEVERISVDCLRDLPPIRADYARLERILVNLLSNALKYSAPGTPVDVHARREGDKVVIAVTDHGRGIPPEDLPHLFERFYRGDSVRRAEGIGLGLYITRMLVEAHGGRIRGESQVGVGSTFTVWLPVADQG